MTFGYSPARQIVTRTASNDAYASNTTYAVSRPYSVNGLNQYTAAESYGYDAAGNRAPLSNSLQITVHQGTEAPA